jgi:hypothetical protein
MLTKICFRKVIKSLFLLQPKLFIIIIIIIIIISMTFKM